MEGDGLTVGWTNAVCPAPQSTDAPAVCPVLAGDGSHPCNLDKQKILDLVDCSILHRFVGSISSTGHFTKSKQSVGDFILHCLNHRKKNIRTEMLL